MDAKVQQRVRPALQVLEQARASQKRPDTTSGSSPNAIPYLSRFVVRQVSTGALPSRANVFEDFFRIARNQASTMTNLEKRREGVKGGTQASIALQVSGMVVQIATHMKREENRLLPS